MLKDMNRNKYKAILEFFNGVASKNYLKQAKDFFDVYKYQLSTVLKTLKFNDSLDTLNDPADDLPKMTKEILDNNDLGIDFSSQIFSFEAKTEIEIGKILIAIIYHLKLNKPDLFDVGLQHVDTRQNFDLEIQHIILFLENKEQWPRDGWPEVLDTPLPMDMSDRVKPLPSIHSATISRTPLRRSMRQPNTSPFKRVSSDSPITKTKNRDYANKIKTLQREVIQWRQDCEYLDHKYGELLLENKVYKEENQKLKTSVENAKLKLQDYQSLIYDFDKLKSEEGNLQKQVKKLKESNENLSEELHYKKKELEAAISDANDKEDQIESLQKEKETLKKQVDDLKDELIEAKSDRDVMQKRFNEAENALKRKHQENEMLKMQNSEMSRMSLSVADQSNMILTDENERLRDQITQISREFEDEKNELKQEHEQKENLLNDEIERLNTKLTEVVRDSEKRKVEVESYKKLESEKTAEILKCRSQISETTGKFDAMKEIAAEWEIKYKEEHEKLLQVQGIKDHLLRKEKVLEETVETQNDEISVFKRKQIGALATKCFCENISKKERIPILQENEPPSFYRKRIIYRSPQEFYFNCSK
uniref:Uncharacterized protein n=1 Tax=Panagrolaimus sp. PS1159 TaxID=55785 RepID=A0AC35GCX5_9BILA